MATVNLRQKLQKRDDFDRLFAKTPLRVLFDDRLTHADRSTYDAISFLCFPGCRCVASLMDIAEMLGTGKAHASRSVRRLERAGHLRWLRPTKEFELLDSLDQAEKQGMAPPSKCKQCGRTDRPVNAVEICVLCRKANAAEEEVTQILCERGPEELHVVWGVIHASGSKSGVKAIRRAYLKLVPIIFPEKATA